ncbi:MAG: hypothetical protein EZS28_030315 [Streblomastix strix]|uniref:Uncharacterized protein n=1 Tax=Streblomastix strix TaxID=222440 RepID=A0A5J4UVJ6_9EUKA|nr:MAG: hypothetical protein EZS28_030315 [Streblomastix strix]
MPEKKPKQFVLIEMSFKAGDYLAYYPVNQLTSSGVKYTGAPLVNWTITIPKDTLAIQLNETSEEADDYNKRVNFNGKVNSQAQVTKSITQVTQKYYGKDANGYENSECLRFWIGFSNIQVILLGNLTKGIIDTTTTNQFQKYNDLNKFNAMKRYLDPSKVNITHMTHYLCDAFVRFTFDDNPDPLVLNIVIIGELGGSSILAG